MNERDQDGKIIAFPLENPITSAAHVAGFYNPNKDLYNVIETVSTVEYGSGAMDNQQYWEYLRTDQQERELRLREEQKQIESRMNATVSRIEKHMERLEDKMDTNIKETREAKRWGWGIAITVAFSLASVIISLVK